MMEKQKSRRELDLFVSEVLLGSDRHGVLPAIRNTKRQFPVCRQYHEHQIFIEAYVRAIKKIESRYLQLKIMPTIWLLLQQSSYLAYLAGILVLKSLDKKIVNFPAWFKKTTFYIIWEYAKKIIKKYKNEVNYNINNVLASDENKQLLSLDEKTALTLRNLTPRESLIIWLQLEGLSWTNIASIFVRCGEEDENTPEIQKKLCQEGKQAWLLWYQWNRATPELHEILEHNQLRLKKALKKLKHRDKLLLNLKLVEKRTWSEIADYLVCCGEEDKNTPTVQNRLCQQGRRAKTRLFRHFLSG